MSGLEKIWKKKPRYNKDGTLRKPRRGWGPYRSVVNERATAFNLQLDVQDLQQEVQNLTALRDILQTKTLLQRHTPEGSLLRVVKEYFNVFRAGSVLKESGRKRLLEDKDQRAFMHSVMDTEVDVGNGLHGPDVMMDQMTMYSTFIKFIRLTMHSYSIVVAEDEVVITTHAALRFQILRDTIEMIFPHIIGEEWLVAELVGREVEPAMGITFYFNPSGMCCKYEVDLDFVGAFTSIVKDPVVVDLLLGRALIADNCMFGVIDEPKEPEEEEKPAVPASLTKALRDERDALERQLIDLGHDFNDAEMPFSPAFTPLSRPTASTGSAQVLCLRVVEDYYTVFTNGYQAEDKSNAAKDAAAAQREFIVCHFAPTTTFGDQTSAGEIVHRWRSLSKCFGVLGFHQKAVASVEYDSQADMCVIKSSARYILRIMDDSVKLVFPHLAARKGLQDALLGKVIAVSSQIEFSIESDTGRIRSVAERMDFVLPITKLLSNGQDASSVLSKARLALDGVSYRDTESMPTFLCSPVTRPKLGETVFALEGPRKIVRTEPIQRSMRIADLLN